MAELVITESSPPGLTPPPGSDLAPGAQRDPLSALASEQARLRRWGILSLVGLAVGLTWVAGGMPGAGMRTTVVRAHRIVLQDLGGRPVAILTAGAEGPSVLLQDRRGRDRLTLAVNGEWPEIRLADADGRIRVALRLEADGSPGLTFSEWDGMVHVALGVASGGRPIFLVRGPNGGPSATVGGSPPRRAPLRPAP